MPMCRDLPEQQRMELYAALQSKISEEAQAMYEIVSARSDTPVEKDSYIEQFKGEWFSLLCLWTENSVPSKFVRESLSAGYVIGK